MNIQEVWQSQATEAPRISLDYVRQQSTTLERRARWRNAFEYGSGVLGVVVCLWVAWQQTSGRPLLLAGVIWGALWAVYYAIRWHQLASVAVRPEEAGVLDTLRFQRKLLERQRDARRGSWRWWGLPSLPSIALCIASAILEVEPVSWGTVLSIVAWVVVGGGVVIWVLEREARRFQREIDALDSLKQ